jgi:hypothetical protein
MGKNNNMGYRYDVLWNRQYGRSHHISPMFSPRVMDIVDVAPYSPIGWRKVSDIPKQAMQILNNDAAYCFIRDMHQKLTSTFAEADVTLDHIRKYPHWGGVAIYDINEHPARPMIDYIVFVADTSQGARISISYTYNSGEINLYIGNGLRPEAKRNSYRGSNAIDNCIDDIRYWLHHGG